MLASLFRVLLSVLVVALVLVIGPGRSLGMHTCPVPGLGLEQVLAM